VDFVRCIACADSLFSIFLESGAEVTVTLLLFQALFIAISIPVLLITLFF
jgi:hypothetical protein